MIHAPKASPDPCVLVIFGASGDLTRRKLIPALFELDQQGRLPEQIERLEQLRVLERNHPLAVELIERAGDKRRGQRSWQRRR